MSPLDAALLAIAASAIIARPQRYWLAALAPFTVLAADLPFGVDPWLSELLQLLPLLLAAIALRIGAAPALLLCIPEYSYASDALLASGIWLGGTLLLEPLFLRLDRAKLPPPIAGTPIRLLCCGGLALALHPLSQL